MPSFDQKIPYDTIKSWKKNQNLKRKKGIGRKPKSEELDEKPFEWFIDSRALKFPVDNKIFMTKAIKIRDELVEEAEKTKEEEKVMKSFLIIWKNCLNLFNKESL